MIERASLTHMSLNVRGCLRQTPNNNKLSWVNDDSGRALTNKQLRYVLMKADFEGKRLLPMSDDCDNFDHEHGCPGHLRYLLVWDWEFEEGNG